MPQEYKYLRNININTRHKGDDDDDDDDDDNNTAIIFATHTQGSALQTSEMKSAYRSKHLMPCHWNIMTEFYTIRSQTVFFNVEPSLQKLFHLL